MPANRPATSSFTSDSDLELGFPEILRAPPSWVAGVGLASVAVGIIVFGIAAAVIPFPSEIMAPLEMSTVVAPVEIRTASAGSILAVRRVDGAFVQKGETIAVVGTSEDERSVSLVRSYAAEIEIAVASNAPVPALNSVPLMGDLGEKYGALFLARERFVENSEAVQLQQKVSSDKLQLDTLTKRRSLLAQQAQDYELARKTLAQKVAAMNALLKQNAISVSQVGDIQRDFYITSASEASTEASVNSLDQNIEITQAEILQAQSAEQLAEREVKAQFLEAFFQLQGSLRAWDQEHVIRAPISGRMTYFVKRAVGDFVQSGDDFATIAPPREVYIGSALVPARGIGRVSVGQGVEVALDNYPEQEYGRLNGVITKISGVAQNGSYEINIALSKDLHSTRGTTERLTEGMPGTLHIPVDHRTLAQWMLKSL